MRSVLASLVPGLVLTGPDAHRAVWYYALVHGSSLPKPYNMPTRRRFRIRSKH